MTTNNNFSVIPWYKSLSEQRHRAFYAYGHVYNLFAPIDYLLPFQIVRKAVGSTTINSSWSAYLYNQDGERVTTDIINKLASAGLTIKGFSTLGYEVIVFPATSALNLGVQKGIYYLSLSDGINTWYSDLITLTDVRDCLKVQWWDDADFIMESGAIVYETGFKHTLYLDSTVGKPKYEYEEEGDTRDGYFFAEKQISEKTYNFTFIAPEYLCDAVRFIRLSDNVIVSQNLREYNVDNFVAEVEWQAQGDLAIVIVEFKTNTVAKKIAPGFNDYSTDYNSAYTNE